jgi:hypothetical protein
MNLKNVTARRWYLLALVALSLACQACFDLKL